MKIEPSEFFPVSRREGLVSKRVEGELLIYDRTRDQAHCLNESAAAIWRLCDGRTSVPEIARRLGEADGRRQTADGSKHLAGGGRRSTVDSQQSTAQAIDEQVVWLGLDELRRKHLLEEPAAWPQVRPGVASMSRREAVRRFGLGAAIALPLVASIMAPTPAQAATCKAAGQPCGTSSQCCSGTCSGGSCLGGPLNRDRDRR